MVKIAFILAIVLFVCCSGVVANVYGDKNDNELSLPSTLNCTWKYIEQPLSHFARGLAGTYKQRLCVYDSYWQPNQGLPVFLYTGNESPVDEYVNNTGLMWNLAESMQALIIFAEHRYFGESIPNIEGMENCMSYLSSEEALADYASLANRVRQEWGAKDSAFIAFGGSYGGMLASWIRFLYPSVINGAIAASAPIWGFPLTDCDVDSSAKVVSYSASSAAGASERCADNLKSAYVLISDIGKTKDGREVLSDAMNLCTPVESTLDVTALLNYLQTPLFDLSEGSYPFPSDYITFALTGTDAPLPPWAMQVMCDPLGNDFDVRITGDTDSVNFTVSAPGNIDVYVNWDETSNNGYDTDALLASASSSDKGALALTATAAQAIQVWYNVTGTLPSCINWAQGSAPNARNKIEATEQTRTMEQVAADKIKANPLSKQARHHQYKGATSALLTESNSASGNNVPRGGADNVCELPSSTIDVGTAWNTLVCNEGINLINWFAQGVGGDMYWPPNQAKDYSTETLVPGSLAYCSYLKAMGLYGVPDKRDEWAEWMDTAYGGLRLEYASNIVFSNGNLDPWSSAGVVGKGKSVLETVMDKNGQTYDVQKQVLSRDGTVVAATIDMGGHHLDLFWPTAEDPDSARAIRALETASIETWIAEHAAVVAAAKK